MARTPARQAHPKDRTQQLIEIAQKDPKRRGHLPQVGSVQLLIICATEVLGYDAYTVKITEQLDAWLGRRVNLGQVFAAVEDLVGVGVLSRSMRPSPHGSGRDVAIYKITPKGRKVVRLILELNEREDGTDEPQTKGRRKAEKVREDV